MLASDASLADASDAGVSGSTDCTCQGRGAGGGLRTAGEHSVLELELDAVGVGLVLEPAAEVLRGPGVERLEPVLATGLTATKGSVSVDLRVRPQ